MKGKLVESRSEILISLGFASYAEYLKSETWQRVRRVVFEMKGRRCCCCGKAANQIHHSSYTRRNLTGDSVNSIDLTMFPVCSECHYRIHFKGESFRKMKDARNSLNNRKRRRSKKSAKAGRKSGKILMEMRRDKAAQDSILGPSRPVAGNEENKTI